MSRPAPADVTARLARLERTARRWRLAALGLAALGLTGALMGQIRIGGGAGGGISAPAITVETVNCKKVALAGADGTARASLALDANDNLVFALKDKNGTDSLRLQAEADGGATVRLLSSKGKVLAAVAVDGKDKPTVTLQDNDGKKLFTAP